MSRSLVFVLSLALSLLLQIVNLPDSLALARPSWPLLVIGYWALYEPQMPSLIGAWLLGLCCDVLFNSALGEHALALVIASAVIVRLRGTIALFSIGQAALALVPVWALYTLLLFTIDRITHHAADPVLRWLPVLSTALLWPLCALLLTGTRLRHERNQNRLRLP